MGVVGVCGGDIFGSFMEGQKGVFVGAILWGRRGSICGSFFGGFWGG